nr:uncharacterized mitochondrial protein AtMg00810-like [Tanacetum cinerariifolium]
KITIATKWILKNKRDARGIMVRNKARLVAQGYRQEEGIDYDQGCQSSVWTSSSTQGLIYVDDIIFGSTNKAWCDEFEVLMKGEFEMSAMASRPDIIFVVSACSRHQVTPLTSHLNAVKKIFKYLKGHPNLGLWYPRDSPFQLEAYSDSDYAGSYGDKKSTTGGCQSLGRMHHFIRDAYEKNLIQVVKIHTDENVADLLNKAFDGPRFYYLIVFMYILPYFLSILSCRMNEVSCGLLLYFVSNVSGYPKLQVVQLLVHADDLVLAGCCIIPTGSYSFMLMTWIRETYKNVSQDIRDQLNVEAKAVQFILIGIDNDIYSTVDACPNACEMWKAIERLKQGESINAQDLETNLYWEFGKFTSHDGESLESYYLRSAGYENQRDGNVAGARETVETEKGKGCSLSQGKDVIIEEIDQNDDDNDLAKERELLASLIEKLKCEIDESKNCNKFLETSNKVLIEQLKGEIEDFKNKNKSLESSNNFFNEANNKLSETNNLLYANYKKSEAELARRNSMEYASQMEIECEKVRGDLFSYKMDYQKSCTKYTATINALNQTISEMTDKLSAHQETISILSKQKEAQIKLYKTQEDKELGKVIELENKVKVLDNIVYKTGQLIQTMNMLNNKCRMSFAKPEFLKKAQRVNTRLYDIGFYNDNITLMLAPDSDEVIRLEKESRSKLSDLIRPFDYTKLNNLYDLFVPQREKSSEQHYFLERSRMRHINVNNRKSKESFNKQTTLSEKRIDESIQLDKQFTAQTLPPNKKSILKNMNVLAPGMYKINTDHTQTRTSQLPQNSRKTNKRVSFSTGVIPTTSVSRPQLKSNLMGDRVMRNSSQGKKQEVEDQRRNVKLSKNKTYVTACNDSLNAKTLNVKSISAMCDKCVLIDKHDMCVLKSVAKPLKETIASESNKKPRNFTRKLYERIVKIVLFIVDSGCSKHMTGNLKLLINFMEKFLGTIKFGNDQTTPILGYGDLVQGAVTIKRVYYVEGLNHNLFSVG